MSYHSFVLMWIITVVLGVALISLCLISKKDAWKIFFSILWFINGAIFSGATVEISTPILGTEFIEKVTHYTSSDLSGGGAVFFLAILVYGGVCGFIAKLIAKWYPE